MQGPTSHPGCPDGSAAFTRSPLQNFTAAYHSMPAWLLQCQRMRSMLGGCRQSLMQVGRSAGPQRACSKTLALRQHLFEWHVPVGSVCCDAPQARLHLLPGSIPCPPSVPCCDATHHFAPVCLVVATHTNQSSRGLLSSTIGWLHPAHQLHKFPPHPQA